MRITQRTAKAVFGVTFAALIPFWITKGAEPSGHAVLWILYGISIGSGLVWLATTVLNWRKPKSSAPETAEDGRRIAIDVEGGSLDADGVRVRNHDAALKAKGTEINLKDFDAQ